MFNRKKLERALDIVNGLEPDIVLITGDLTEWGLHSEFTGIKDILDSMDMEYLAVAGNHDARTNGYKVYQQMFCEHRDRFFWEKYDDYALIGLDSSEPDRDEGHVGREQMRWLEGVLKDCENMGLVPIIFMHHHLIPIPDTGRERNVLVDAGDVLKLIDEHKVPLVLMGHRHVPWVWRLNDCTLIHASTVSCERTNARNSFNIVDLKKKKIVCHRVDVLSGERKKIVDCCMGVI